jgi:hypothetical protein
MADLNINDLAGTDLFDDSESFLDELNDREMTEVEGGATIGGVFTVVGSQAASFTINQSASIVQTQSVIY